MTNYFTCNSNGNLYTAEKKNPQEKGYKPFYNISLSIDYLLSTDNMKDIKDFGREYKITRAH